MNDESTGPEPLHPDPEIAALLDFDPVPLKLEREIGWTAEVQRAYVAALALTGAPTRAAKAVEMAPAGVDRIKKLEGAGPFVAACEDAQALFAARRSATLRANLAELASPSRKPDGRSGDDPYAPAEDVSGEERERIAMTLFERYAVRLRLERQERLAGRIAAADFYLRQATFTEDCMHVTGLFRLLSQAKLGDHGIIAIAATPLSRFFAKIREAMWAEGEEPMRPEPPEHLFVEHRDPETGEPYWTEPAGESTGRNAAVGSWIDPDEWKRLDYIEQRKRYEEQHRRDAEAYRDWLERATAEWRESTEGKDTGA